MQLHSGIFIDTSFLKIGENEKFTKERQKIYKTNLIPYAFKIDEFAILMRHKNVISKTGLVLSLSFFFKLED